MEVKHLHGKTIDASEWDAFVKQSPHGSLYSRHAYLSASHQDWEALIATEEGQWQGVFPLFPKQRFGVYFHWQPLFSQYTGILLKPLEARAPLHYYQQQKTIIEALLHKLPAFQLFSGQFPPTFDYPLPFAWQDYSLHCRYTYQLALTQPTSFGSLRKNLQRNISKAANVNWTIQSSADTETFTALIKQALSHQLPTSASRDRLRTIADTLLDQGLGNLLAATDKSGQLVAAILLGHDANTTYYLIGAAKPSARKQGAISRLLWEGIQQAATFTQTFDFEGSMKPSLEHFFRGFGAHPVPYLRIYQNRLPLKPLWAVLGY